MLLRERTNSKLERVLDPYFINDAGGEVSCQSGYQTIPQLPSRKPVSLYCVCECIDMILLFGKAYLMVLDINFTFICSAVMFLFIWCLKVECEPTTYGL